MSERISLRAHPSGSLFVLTCGLVLAMTIGFLDLLLGLLSSRQQFPTFSLAMISLALTTMTILILFLLLEVVLIPVVNRFAREHRGVHISIALLLGNLFLFGSLSNFQFRASPNYLMQVALALLFSAACAVLTFLAIRTLNTLPEVKKAARTVVFSMPFLFAGTSIALQWMRALNNRTLALAAFLLIEAAMTITILWILHRYASEKRIAKTLTGFLLAVLTVAYITNSGSESNATLSAKQSPQKRPVKYVVLITIDTLRADALQLYGDWGTQTPNIERLAQEATLFRNAFSEAPWTLPSMATILTGLNPLAHGIVEVKRKLPRTIPTLAEYMHNAGYITAAIGSNTLLEKNTFSRGFMEYSFQPIDSSFLPAKKNLGLTLLRRMKAEKKGYSSTKRITDISRKWLTNNRDKDFFLWIHYFDPHHPYEAQKKYVRVEEQPSRIGMNATRELVEAIKSGHFVPTAKDRNWIKHLYLAEVRFVDAALGIIFETMKEAGIYDQAMIVLTSDHGEEFWEHGTIGHSHTVYNELLQVPLIVKFPGDKTRVEVSKNVSTSQIMPTILEVAAIPFQADSFSSRSLTASQTTENIVVSTGVSIGQRSIAALNGNMKYVRDVISNQEELYDLSNDPYEQTSLARILPETVETVSNLLKKFEEESSRLRELYRVTDFESNIDAETEEQLRGLGYIQ